MGDDIQIIVISQENQNLLTFFSFKFKVKKKNTQKPKCWSYPPNTQKLTTKNYLTVGVPESSLEIIYGHRIIVF